MSWFRVSRGRAGREALTGTELRGYLHLRLKAARLALGEAITPLEREACADRVHDLEVALGIRQLRRGTR